MGEAHPRMISPAQPAKSNPDKARGVGPAGRRGEAPGYQAFPRLKSRSGPHTPRCAADRRWKFRRLTFTVGFPSYPDHPDRPSHADLDRTDRTPPVRPRPQRPRLRGAGGDELSDPAVV